MTKGPGWNFYIDRGGTFTDIVAASPDGRISVEKLLSEDPENYRDAAVEGIRRILRINGDEMIPLDIITSVRMGTTVGTNALLERRGERTALLITKGFGDVLRIGYQNRPDLFSLKIDLPELLYDHVEEIDERILADGTVLKELDEREVRDSLQRVRGLGFDSIAIVLLNSYVEPEHERTISRIASDMGFSQISASCETSPLMKIVGRGDTTVVDAYLFPILLDYIDSVKTELGSDIGECDLLFMQSSGGLVDHGKFRGKDCILSGPAGGIIGAVNTSIDAGFENIITFDMGGTSTDVAHYSGELERSFETEVAGIRMRAPMLRIHTVAAGGGSILKFEDGRFKVGPDSAGADPGPACYRKGGPLTVTDANLLLGRIQLEHFPSVFGESGDLPPDRDAVVGKFETLSRAILAETGKKMEVEEIAEGFLKIAVENMAQAIKTISTMRGYDVSEHVLTCFGGAGGQHACKVAEALGMRKVLIHPLAGVLSAYGMGLAEIRSIRERTVERVIDSWIEEELDSLIDDLKEEVRGELFSENVRKDDIRFETRVHLKYSGTSKPLPVSYSGIEDTIASFEREHMERFSFIMKENDIVIDTIEVEGIGGSDRDQTMNKGASRTDPSGEEVMLSVKGQWKKVPLYQRDELPPGMRIEGPAMIAESTGTNVIDEGWIAIITGDLDLILERDRTDSEVEDVSSEVDPVMLEIFNKLFMSNAEQMGYSLQNTSISVNIKERLDFSCAIFDGSGDLVANAPHIPVHLGSMSQSVKRWLEDQGDEIRKGEVYLVNSPYHGGTHLPDVTVITPVIDGEGSKPVFFVASRGHHADIGGKTPGSMPPDSTTIFEEGAISSGMRIVEDGRFLEEKVRNWLSSGDHPARDPDRNISDIKAQIAANEKGVKETWKMIEKYSLDVVRSYMSHVQRNAERSVKEAIGDLHGGSAVLEMDQGSRISVKVDIDREGQRAVVDLEGTSPMRDDNFNAPSAICSAAVLYVFRSLVRKDIPLNRGCLAPIDIRIPEGSMLDPVFPAAVVAGNVETSMFIADAILEALGVLGGSQGTMNNLTFGNTRHQYYETICGGTGAGSDFSGTDAVHSHMTNTRITDPEVLEHDHPVILEEFSIRRGSGGEGRQNGGSGVVRRMRFLEKMTVSIISQHRTLPTHGINGGGNGITGKNLVIRKDGRIEDLGGCASAELEPGDAIEIRTPGGGGFGTPQDSES